MKKASIQNAQRILVLGPPGAGKSYLSKKLSEKLDLPFMALDLLYWKKDWQPTPVPEFKKVCSELSKKEKWVMDGNFGTTFDERWSEADLVIYLQPHLWICLWRQIVRAVLNKKDNSRPKGMRERFNLDLFWFTKKFEKAHGKLIMTYMKEKFPQLPVLKVRAAEEILEILN